MKIHVSYTDIEQEATICPKKWTEDEFVADVVELARCARAISFEEVARIAYALAYPS